MLFSSITFLFAFLPTILLVYYISPRKLKNTVLMIFSLFFYAWGEPIYVFIMIFSIIIGYVLGLVTDRYMKAGKEKHARAAMICAVSINLLILIYFKYIGFFVENIMHIIGLKLPEIIIKLPFGIDFSVLSPALPLGISFYTFQILSYSVDVYRGTVKPQRNIINLAAYVTLFPQLIAGPIVRYETVCDELDNRRESIDDFGEGVKGFIVGLGKKVMIANVAGELYSTLSVLSADDNTVLLSWICSIAYTLQIYFDFSGYSDMAVGLGKMFGFHFLENFNYPYISKSITEFWRRWHISLSTWFRDYVYIPLGGNRNGKWKTIRNIFVVWLLTGFWHGAEWNFIIWGLYYFVLLMIEKNGLLKKLEKAPKLIQHIYALFFINIGWVIFSYDNMGSLKHAFANMFGMGGLPFINQRTLFYLVTYGLFLIIACVGTTPLPKKIGEAVIRENGKTKAALGTVAQLLFLFAVLLISTAFLASDAFNPFLYFRF